MRQRQKELTRARLLIEGIVIQKTVTENACHEVQWILLENYYYEIQSQNISIGV